MKGYSSIDTLDSPALLDEGMKPEGLTTYGSFAAFAVTLNAIVGTGCFALPYAFQSGGLGLATFLLVFASGLSLVSMIFTLEAMARAEGAEEGAGSVVVIGTMHRLTSRKHDFAKIARQFGGRRLEAVTQLCLQCYGLGTLCAYASVFGSTVASLVSSEGDCDPSSDASCFRSYQVSVLLFGVLVVALSLVDLGDQAVFQNVLSVYRLVALVIMIVTAGVGVVVGEEAAVVAERARRIGVAKWRNVGFVIGPTFLALAVHYNVPDLLQPLADKSKAGVVTFGAQIVAASLYLCLGVVGALAFDDVRPLATLNWRNYGADDPTVFKTVVIRYLILLAPVVNVVSAYPLVGRTVAANGLQTLSFFRRRSGDHRPPPSSSRGRAVVVARLVATVPPIFVAATLTHLATVFAVAGLFGLLLSLTVPAALQFASIAYCLRHKRPGDDDLAATKTPFTFKRLVPPSKALAALFLAFSLLVTAVATVSLFLSD